MDWNKLHFVPTDTPQWTNDVDGSDVKRFTKNLLDWWLNKCVLPGPESSGIPASHSPATLMHNRISKTQQCCVLLYSMNHSGHSGRSDVPSSEWKVMTKLSVLVKIPISSHNLRAFQPAYKVLPDNAIVAWLGLMARGCQDGKCDEAFPGIS
ncbi:hypothetical protein BD779DRAFT_1477995 [Infundibulicybe gibba]|nr:hypothetical protein BD779DRAFT_1477995 [Infundibulicybe gibba]